MSFKRGDILPRPVGVSWFNRYEKDELLDLTGGEQVWEIIDGTIRCGVITAPSKRLLLRSHPELSGIQVFYSLGNKVYSPRLIEDKDKIPLYQITSERAARTYFKSHENKEESPTPLRLVS